MIRFAQDIFRKLWTYRVHSECRDDNSGRKRQERGGSVENYCQPSNLLFILWQPAVGTNIISNLYSYRLDEITRLTVVSIRGNAYFITEIPT